MSTGIQVTIEEFGHLELRRNEQGSFSSRKRPRALHHSKISARPGLAAALDDGTSVTDRILS
jgi:hypothetical protein